MPSTGLKFTGARDVRCCPVEADTISSQQHHMGPVHMLPLRREPVMNHSAGRSAVACCAFLPHFFAPRLPLLRYRRAFRPAIPPLTKGIFNFVQQRPEGSARPFPSSADLGDAQARSGLRCAAAGRRRGRGSL